MVSANQVGGAADGLPLGLHRGDEPAGLLEIVGRRAPRPWRPGPLPARPRPRRGRRERRAPRVPSGPPLDGVQEPRERLEQRRPGLRDAAAHDDHDLGIDHVHDRRDAAGQPVHGAEPDLRGLGVARAVGGHELARVAEAAARPVRHRAVADHRLEGARHGGGGRGRAVGIEATCGRSGRPGRGGPAASRPSLRMAPPTPVPRVSRTAFRHAARGALPGLAQERGLGVVRSRARSRRVSSRAAQSRPTRPASLPCRVATEWPSADGQARAWRRRSSARVRHAGPREPAASARIRPAQPPPGSSWVSKAARSRVSPLSRHRRELDVRAAEVDADGVAHAQLLGAPPRSPSIRRRRPGPGR